MKRGKTKKIQQKKKSTGFVLALIALAILLLNIILVFTSSQWIIETLAGGGYPIPTNFLEVLMTSGILWTVLAIITIMLIISYEARRTKAWWLMLILGIVVLITGRIETAILLIIASFFYKKNLKQI